LTPSEVNKGKTIYRLKFVPDALKEWQTLDGSIKEPLRKALRKRLEQPHMPGAELHGDLHGCYKSNCENKDTVWFIRLKTMFWWFWCWPLIAEKTWRHITLQCLDC